MDLRQFYKKVRDMERSFTGPYVMVTSSDTSDGGQAGLVSEVSREVAAMLIVEGKSSLATEAEGQSYLAAQEAARAAHEKAELAQRLQVAIISDPDGKYSPRKSAIR